MGSQEDDWYAQTESNIFLIWSEIERKPVLKVMDHNSCFRFVKQKWDPSWFFMH